MAHWERDNGKEIDEKKYMRAKTKAFSEQDWIFYRRILKELDANGFHYAFDYEKKVSNWVIRCSSEQDSHFNSEDHPEYGSSLSELMSMSIKDLHSKTPVEIAEKMNIKNNW